MAKANAGKANVGRMMFTIKHIEGVRKLWEEKNTNDIANELGISREQVAYLAAQIRAAGYKLPRKHNSGYLKSLIHQAFGNSNGGRKK